MKKFFIYFALSVFAFLFLLTAGVWWTLPSEKQIRACLTTTMFHVELCPGSKNYVPYSQVSKHLIKSVIVSEDSNFWTHHGFDWDELQNSLKANLSKGEYARGGSTISQQLAKNLFLSQEKSLLRKLREALITRRLEQTLNKKEILERYLNVIEFGKGLFGVRQASWHYFKKSPSQLDILESTFLTMLLPSPKKYSKSFHQKSLTPYARKRMSVLLQRLRATHYISEADYETLYLQLDWFLKDKAPTENLELSTSDEGENSLDQLFADPSDSNIETEPTQDQQN